MYYTVQDHLRTAYREQIAAISHRGEDFKNLYRDTQSNLQQLLGFSDDYAVIFLPSATEVWSMLISNCVAKKSSHIVNGAFSEKFYNTAKTMKVPTQLIEIDHGEGFQMSGINVDEDADLIAIVHNETSTGVSQPLEDIYQLSQASQHALLAIDGVSSIPHPDLDFEKIDCAYFSVQKCFGLPAGLGVCLVNRKCLEKAQVGAGERALAAHQSLPKMFELATRHQTVYTPNVLGIYLLNAVCKDMLMKGIDQIRRETEYKAAVLYQTLSSHSLLQPFVKQPEYRSKTVVVGEMENSKRLIEYLSSKSMVVGSGYGQFSNDHFRIANFPTHSKEHVEQLADFIAAFE